MPCAAAEPAELTEQPAVLQQMGDVTGLIRPNKSRKNTNTPYVVVDHSGAILYYLRPAPGMSLDRYVNRRVHVSGKQVETPGDSMPVMEVKQVGPPENTASRTGAVGPADAASPEGALAAGATQQVAYQLKQPGRRGSIVDGDAEVEPSGDIQPISHDAPQAAATAAPGPVPVPDDNYAEEIPWQGADGGCSACGGCGCSACGCGPPGIFWARAEYLYWWTSGMHIPPLVTTGPSTAQPGYLDTPGTTILYGQDRINGFGRSGVRLTGGTWLNACQTVGVEGDWFALSTATSNFAAGSNGTDIISRPFYDLSPTQADPSQIVGQNIEQVSSPGSLAGTVSVASQTRFQSAGLRALFNLCCSNSCYDSCCPSLSGPGWYRLDFLVGYRYARLSDNLGINENLTSLVANNPGTFLVNDRFSTQNTFNGVEFGTSLQANRARWTVELLTKLAMGTVNEMVSIDGSTTTTQFGSPTTSAGGLLAQSTNIGNYSRNQFAVMPQLGANLGYQLTPRLRATFGYTFLYLSRVVRPGDQIDLDVNSRLLPNDTRPLAGDTQHPAFAFQETDFWAQGISAGLDFRW